MPKIRTDLPRCKALVGENCIIALALAGKLQEWKENWPLRKFLKPQENK